MHSACPQSTVAKPPASLDTPNGSTDKEREDCEKGNDEDEDGGGNNGKACVHIKTRTASPTKRIDQNVVDNSCKSDVKKGDANASIRIRKEEGNADHYLRRLGN